MLAQGVHGRARMREVVLPGRLPSAKLLGFYMITKEVRVLALAGVLMARDTFWNKMMLSWFAQCS